MAKFFDSITDPLRRIAERQHIFFVASAAEGARVNVSPRPTRDTLRITGPNEVIYLDMTGSGMETAAHLKADGRMTMMFCSFDAQPMIVRFFGTGRSVFRGSDEYQALLDAHFDGKELPGARQIVVQTVEAAQSSCGYGVPFFEYQGERPTLREWSERKGEDGIKAYWQDKGLASQDGLPTGLEVALET
ncbi:pyridoxamine 5'-phosphate oxidase family protein [Celeribacter neptunius]|uniref:Pyridoxamine 5'-phosphate oxidase n=1 Tax=Celeribacter neptunius TaxID=588602 RepID=A0A1I3Y5P2_9RHOB|nr:pyridoxamine 5'-phosphate oxidase family protein [Celeribacter neptunius]SFK27063.1 Pyridoxamine 5'-phosphate oxidase [Celeribacter neptunius]